MACRLSSSKITELKARHTKLVAQRDLLDTAIDEATTTPATYRFDDGEGSQMTKHRPLQELLDARKTIEASIARIERRLNGTGIINHGLRRA